MEDPTPPLDTPEVFGTRKEQKNTNGCLEPLGNKYTLIQVDLKKAGEWRGTLMLPVEPFWGCLRVEVDLLEPGSDLSCSATLEKREKACQPRRFRSETSRRPCGAGRPAAS